MNLKKRFSSYPFWVSIFAFVAITGQTFGLYQVPQGWDTWVNVLLAVLVASGIVVDPTTKGYKD